MDFGYYLTCFHSSPESGPLPSLYDDTLQQARIAEELGFTSVSIPEHHFNNYLTIPSPLVMAAAVAQQTRFIKIVSAVLVLPFYDIRRLAGEIALTDQLTGGRLQLGLGRGAFRYEFDRFDSSIEESRDRFSELVGLLDRLLTEEEVTHEGRYYQIDLPLTVMPRPRQQPRPPFFIAALAEGSINWALSQGHNLQTTPLRAPFEVTRKQAQWFVEARDRLPAEMPRPVHHMLRNVYVSKSRTDLREKAELLRANHRQFVNLYETPGTVHNGYTAPIDVEMTADEAAHNVLIGDPDEVIERLQVHAELGIDAVQVNMAFGASHDDVVRCMELFAEEVMPALGSGRKTGQASVPA
jgi:alkanesulfonate monooxygenase SsuD/methylene tetrahydromethanopterin reductase-like flavin-dependent oxidoreductase (luciferase family)